MKKLLLILLLLALPSASWGVEPTGTLVLVPDAPSDGGPNAAPKSWLTNSIFFVRNHVCRATGFTICGPDNLVNSGFSFSGVIRIAVPFSESVSIFLLVTDSEGAVVLFDSGTFFLSSGYASFFNTFPPLSSGLYKLVSLAQGNNTGLLTISEPYIFRIGGPDSSGCCP